MAWVCPRCRRSFGNANQWHSCVDVSVQDHLEGKPVEVVALYGVLADFLRGLGADVQEVPVKSKVYFRGRSHFVSVQVQKGGLRVGFTSDRALTGARILKSVPMGKDTWEVSVRVRGTEDLDDVLQAWLAMAYRLQCVDGVQKNQST